MYVRVTDANSRLVPFCGSHTPSLHRRNHHRVDVSKLVKKTKNNLILKDIHFFKQINVDFIRHIVHL